MVLQAAKSKNKADQVSVEGLLPGPPLSSHQGRGKGVFKGLCYKGTDPSHEDAAFMTCYLPQNLALTPSPERLGFQHRSG